MRLATIAPTHAPAICTTTYTPASRGGDAAEQAVGHRDDRVEVRARHRAEREDQRDEPGAGRDRVLEQLEPDVVRRQALRVDPRADDDRDQERGADDLGRARRARPRSRSTGVVSSSERRTPAPTRSTSRRRPAATVRSSPGAISTSASTV